MRYVIFGAGAVGGVIGARLFLAGHSVVLIARGRHLEVIRRDGLTLVEPAGSMSLPIPACRGPEELELGEGDIVMLAVKSQDTDGALRSLAGCSSPSLPIICAQNGVANERAAARWFERIYAMTVVLPGSHMTPGEVIQHSSPLAGTLNLGRYPHGLDPLADAISTDLTNAGFRSDVSTEPVRSKYAKLVGNLGNILDAACGPDSRRSDLNQSIVNEAHACFSAAGIDCQPREEYRELLRGLTLSDMHTSGRIGTSTTQSLARGVALETDFINGEIVLLGRLHGVPTPANTMLQNLARRLHAERRPPRSMTLPELRALLAEASD